MPSHHSTKSASHHHQAKHTGGGGSSSSAADNNPDRIEWSRSTILGFIEDYRQKRVLWDPNTKGYHIKQIKYEALKQLGHKYGTEIRSIRSKIKSLRSSFHREHGKVINGRRRGIHYQPMWFAYEAIRFILEAEQQHSRPNNVDDTERSSGEDKRETLAAAGRDGAVQEVGSKAAVVAAGGATAMGEHGGIVDDAERRRIYVGALAAVAEVELEDLSCKREVRRSGVAELVEELPNAGCGGSSSSGSSSANSIDGNSSAAIVRQAAVKCTDVVGEMNHYCSISAEDVKTELIESESSDAPHAVIDKAQHHQSPLAYLSLTAVHHHTEPSTPKKRKRTPLPEIAMPTKQHNGERGGPPPNKMMSTNSKSRSTAEEPSSSTAGGSNALQQQTDEYGVFGEYVAITIRKLKTSKSKIVVKHLINNLLYEAELGKYDYGIPASKEPPQLYKTS